MKVSLYRGNGALIMTEEFPDGTDLIRAAMILFRRYWRYTEFMLDPSFLYTQGVVRFKNGMSAKVTD